MGCRTPSNVERRPVGPRDREAAVSPSSHPPKPPENPRVARPPPTDTRLVEGCASELELGADPAETLRRLASLCLPSMVAVLEEPKVVTIAQGEQRDIEVTLSDAEACVRAVAAGDPDVPEVVASFVDPHGNVHAGSEGPAPVSLVGPQGPVCVAGPGEAKVKVIARRGGGKVAVQVWAAR
jgi:hypothetical protein